MQNKKKIFILLSFVLLLCHAKRSVESSQKIQFFFHKNEAEADEKFFKNIKLFMFLFSRLNPKSAKLLPFSKKTEVEVEITNIFEAIEN